MHATQALQAEVTTDHHRLQFAARSGCERARVKIKSRVSVRAAKYDLSANHFDDPQTQTVNERVIISRAGHLAPARTDEQCWVITVGGVSGDREWLVVTSVKPMQVTQLL